MSNWKKVDESLKSLLWFTVVLFSVDIVKDPQFIETNHTLTMKSEIIPKTLVPINTDYADHYVSK